MERSRLIGLCHRRVRDRESALRSGLGRLDLRIWIGLLACGQRDLESGGGGGQIRSILLMRAAHGRKPLLSLF